MKRTRLKPIRNVVINKDNLVAIYSLLERKGSDLIASVGEVNPSAIRPTIEIASQGAITTAADDRSVFDYDMLDQYKNLKVEFQTI
jgi:hypothetical protein